MDEAVEPALARDRQDALVGLVRVGVVSQLDVAAGHFRHVFDGRPVLADDHAGCAGRDEEAQGEAAFVLGWVGRVTVNIGFGVRGDFVRGLWRNGG